MKTRFTTLDICAVLSEINEKIIGMRLVNVYDIDHKTYLFKLARPDNKAMLLVESGMRIHLSEFDWPKNPMPSNFSVKLRKHLRGRRLVSATQLGIDRIVDLQFGSGDASYHVFVELYDRVSQHVWLWHYYLIDVIVMSQENDDVKTAVHEAYPRTSARGVEPITTIERLQEILKSAKPESVVKRVLNPHLPYGASCIDHSISVAGFPVNAKLGKDFHWETDTGKLHEALKTADEILRSAMTHVCQGFIIQKLEKKSDGELKTNVEFHPYLFNHHKDQPHKQFDSFNKAVDEFFSSLESQKTDMKLLQRERAAMRKLDNVRKDHESRLTGLRSEQENDQEKARLIESNLQMIDEAILVVRSAIANQVDWKEIRSLVHDAQVRGDKVASSIKSLKLETNSMVMSLRWVGISKPPPHSPPVEDWFGSSDEEEVAPGSSVKVEVDLSMSAVFWFEKFLWFISSENYLVIGGRDAQQNEIIVKRYLNQGHPIPPKTLNEAGTMAICHSAAWDAKVVTSAWWVRREQVSKTAPSGEYLTTGSFLIRGKKDYLPPSYLVYGFGFLFKVSTIAV
uniref:Ribosome quality control complex subunit NEMF n=1 Tax=Ciona savignyi TaxID=51511 RepID=H2YKU7_CIOSA